MLNFLIACGGAAASGGGCYDWPVIKQIIILFGWVIEYIYKFLDLIGIPNIALCIIIFTLVIKCAMLPLTIRQQRFTKLTSYVQPELRAVQDKYKGRRDAAATQAIQAETQAIYKKYGISQMTGCLQLFIQFPIMIALYGAIRRIPLLIPSLTESISKIADVLNNSALATRVAISQISTELFSVEGVAAAAESQITALYTLPTTSWNTLLSKFSGEELNVISTNLAQVRSVNSLAGIDISQSCWNLIFVTGGIGILSILLPLLAGVASWLSFKLNQAPGVSDMPGSTGKTMALIMPLFSVYICLTLPASLAIYWAVSSIFQVVLQIIINKKFRNIDMEAFVEKNLEKVEKKNKRKREKKGMKGADLSAAANTDTKNIVPPPPSIKDIANMNVNDSDENAKVQYKPDSLAAKAASVQQYNEEQGEDTSAKVVRKKYKK